MISNPTATVKKILHMQLADLLNTKFQLIDDPNDDEISSDFWINRWSDNGDTQCYELSDREVGLFLKDNSRLILKSNSMWVLNFKKTKVAKCQSTKKPYFKVTHIDPFLIALEGSMAYFYNNTYPSELKGFFFCNIKLERYILGSVPISTSTIRNSQR